MNVFISCRHIFNFFFIWCGYCKCIMTANLPLDKFLFICNTLYLN